MTKYTEKKIVRQVGFVDKITVGHLYQSFSGVTTQLRSEDALTHNVCVVEQCKSKKLYINIHSSLMYSFIKIIFHSPNIHTVIHLQLFEIQRSTVHDIHFAKQLHSSVT